MTLSRDLIERIERCIKLKKYTRNEILDIFNISKNTYNNINNAIKYGSTYNSKRITSRKTKITNPIKKYIISYVTKKGTFEHSRLIFLVKRKFNIDISYGSIYKILKDNKVKKKQTLNKVLLANAEKIEKLTKEFINLLKNVPLDNIISIDETSIDTHIDDTKKWSKYGSKTVITKKNKRIRYTVISAVGYNKVIHHKIIRDSCNGDTFLEFIKELIEKLPKAKVHFILDNAKIHKYIKLREYIKDIRYVKFIYNVPYSPQYNPIEKVFNDVKRDIKNSKTTNENIIRKINTAFNNVKKENLNKYFKKSLNFPE